MTGGLGVRSVTRPDVAPADVVHFTIVPPESAPLDFINLAHDLAVSPEGSSLLDRTKVQ